MRSSPVATGTNHTEGQLFTHSFALPANSRKYLNRLKKAKHPRKDRITTPKDTQAKETHNKKKPSAATDEAHITAPTRPAQPKKTPEERRAYEHARNQTTERKEYLRQYKRNQYRIAKETGKCKHCSNPAIPGQTRCETCAEKHRTTPRKSDAATSGQAILE